MIQNHLKVWIEISKANARHNCDEIRKLLKPDTQLWAVVKSNAYGHGIYTFSPLVADKIDGFCVDSVIEGLTLRRQGISKPILALGPTLEPLYADAATNDICVTASTIEALQLIAKSAQKPKIHLKVDTGMHRQGFLPETISEVFDFCKKNDLPVTGIYSHLADSKNPTDESYNEKQLLQFEKAIQDAETAGYSQFIKHFAGTPATLLGQRYHFDLVRIGNALYGEYPSTELAKKFKVTTSLKPILSLRAKISEIKKIAVNELVGYGLTEKLTRDSELAIIPIGYWHGIPRAASGVMNVLVNGNRAKVIGLISMDLMTIDVTGLNVKIGDVATIIGESSGSSITANELGEAAKTTYLEVLCRLNPLIERVVV